MKLTTAQLRTMLLAKELQANGLGIIPRRGQHGMFKRLAIAGLLEYSGLGKDPQAEDGLQPIYRPAADFELRLVGK